VRIAHSFIIGQGLMPVPPPAPSIVSKIDLSLGGQNIAAPSPVPRPEYAPVLERHALEADLAQPLDLVEERFLGHEAQARIGRSNSQISPSLNAAWFSASVGSGSTMYRLLQFLGALQAVDLDLAADALGALAPLNFSSIVSSPCFSARTRPRQTAYLPRSSAPGFRRDPCEDFYKC